MLARMVNAVARNSAGWLCLFAAIGCASGPPPLSPEARAWLALEASAPTEAAAAAVVLASRIDDDDADAALIAVAAALRDTRADRANAAAEKTSERRRVDARVAAGDLDGALAAARALPPVTRWPKMETVALAWANTRLDKAVEAARTIADPLYRGRALATLGHRLAEENRGAEATDVLGEALIATRRVTDGKAKADVLLSLARTYALGGATRGALSVLSEATGFATELPTGDKDPLLIRIVGLAVEVRQPAPAMAAADAIDDADRKTEAMTRLAEACTDVDCARWILAKAPAGQTGMAARGAAAAALGRLGHTSAALSAAAELSGVAAAAATRAIVAAASSEETRDVALAAANALPEPDLRVAALAGLACVLLNGDDAETGSATLQSALDQAAAAGDPASRTRRLVAIGEAAFAGQQAAVAVRAISDALNTAGDIPDALTRAGVTARIVVLLTEAGQIQAAAQAVGPALSAVKALEFDGSRARILLRLAGLIEALDTHAMALVVGIAKGTSRIAEAERRAPIAKVVAAPLAAAGRVDEAVALLADVPGAARAFSDVAALVALKSGVDEGLALAARGATPGARAVAIARVAAATRSAAPGASGQKILAALVSRK